jgi:hypothetical protein
MARLSKSGSAVGNLPATGDPDLELEVGSSFGESARLTAERLSVRISTRCAETIGRSNSDRLVQSRRLGVKSAEHGVDAW